MGNTIVSVICVNLKKANEMANVSEARWFVEQLQIHHELHRFASNVQNSDIQLSVSCFYRPCFIHCHIDYLKLKNSVKLNKLALHYC